MSPQKGNSMSYLPSRFPADGGVVDRFDKALSSPFFYLYLGPLEILFSLPGAVFGTAPFLFLAPLTLSSVQQQQGLGSLHFYVCLFGWFAYTALWANFLGFFGTARGGRSAERFLWDKYAYAAGPLLGILTSALLSSVENENLNYSSELGPAWSWQPGAFFVTCWSSSLFPIMLLKRNALRRRPCASLPKPLPKKYLPNFVASLEHDGNASFPSGDVSGSVSFAFAFYKTFQLQAGKENDIALYIAVACVCLSVFGRLYWLAHHVMDVSIGGSISLATATLIFQLLEGNILAIQWWHPVIAHGALLTLLTTAFKKIEEKSTTTGGGGADGLVKKKKQ